MASGAPMALGLCLAPDLARLGKGVDARRPEIAPHAAHALPHAFAAHGMRAAILHIICAAMLPYILAIGLHRG